MIKNTKQNVIVLLLGGCSYGMCELAWRGYTHWSMVLVGGVCFLGIYLAERKFSCLPFVLRSACYGIFITSVELVVGSVVNVALKMNVWDYSQMPLDLFGQVCPAFLFAWMALSALALLACSFLRNNFRNNGMF